MRSSLLKRLILRPTPAIPSLTVCCCVPYQVLDVDSKMDGRIRVSVTILQEPNLQQICDREQVSRTFLWPNYTQLKYIISGVIIVQ